MATAKTVVGIVGALGAAAALTVASVKGAKPAAPGTAKTRSVPKDAKHLWAKQPDGGTLLRDPLPTLDDGGCQAWAVRCTDGKCKGSCE